MTATISTGTGRTRMAKSITIMWISTGLGTFTALHYTDLPSRWNGEGLLTCLAHTHRPGSFCDPQTCENCFLDGGSLGPVDVPIIWCNCRKEVGKPGKQDTFATICEYNPRPGVI